MQRGGLEARIRAQSVMKIKRPKIDPDDLRIRANRDDGTLWITHEKFLQPIRPLKDVTNEVLLALCADLNADGVTDVVERSIKFNDGFHCLITVEVVKDEPDA